MASNPPFGGSLDEQSQWAHDNINSDFSVEAWKAQGGMDSGCPPRYPYRSQRAGGDNACVEHPDNCPEGKTLHGSTCITNEQANQMFGGGYGNMAPGAQQQGMQAQQMQPTNPLAGMLAGQQQGAGQVTIGQPGGRPWGEMPDLSRLITPMQGIMAPSAQSATQSLVQPLQQAQRPQAGFGGSMGTGWSGGGMNQLTAMLAKQQRPKASWWA